MKECDVRLLLPLIPFSAAHDIWLVTSVAVWVGQRRRAEYTIPTPFLTDCLENTCTESVSLWMAEALPSCITIHNI